MFPGRYFAARYFNARYWAKVGAAATSPVVSYGVLKVFDGTTWNTV